MTWDDIKHFKPSEFACKCGNCDSDGTEMDLGFMAKLNNLRARLDVPFKVTSGYRCPSYNSRVSNTGADGPHTTGRAADIALSGEIVYTLLEFAPAFGMTGIGFHQKGSHSKRFVHLDNLDEAPRPRVWTY